MLSAGAHHHSTDCLRGVSLGLCNELWFVPFLLPQVSPLIALMKDQVLRFNELAEKKGTAAPCSHLDMALRRFAAREAFHV